MDNSLNQFLHYLKKMQQEYPSLITELVLNMPQNYHFLRHHNSCSLNEVFDYHFFEQMMFLIGYHHRSGINRLHKLVHNHFGNILLMELLLLQNHYHLFHHLTEKDGIDKAAQINRIMMGQREGVTSLLGRNHPKAHVRPKNAQTSEKDPPR